MQDAPQSAWRNLCDQSSTTSVPKTFRGAFREGNFRQKENGATLVAPDYVRKRSEVTRLLGVRNGPLKVYLRRLRLADLPRVESLLKESIQGIGQPFHIGIE